MNNFFRYFKIYAYETKRLLINKLFLSVLIIFDIFSYYILNTEIIRGISYTAPFSKWSYCGYLCFINPILLFVTMFYCLNFFSKKEEKVREITDISPTLKSKLFFIRTITILTSYLILLTIAVLISFLFYWHVFNYTSYFNFFVPILIISLTSFIFSLGLISFLSIKNLTLSYIVSALLIFLSILNLNLPIFLDPFAKYYVFSQPLNLPLNESGEINFILTHPFIISRLIFVLIGIALYIKSLLLQSSKRNSLK